MKKDKQSYTKFCLKFNDSKDGLIIDKLWSIKNKTDYIRRLIMLDLLTQTTQVYYLTDEEYNQVLKYIEEKEKR